MLSKKPIWALTLILELIRRLVTKHQMWFEIVLIYVNDEAFWALTMIPNLIGRLGH